MSFFRFNDLSKFILILFLGVAIFAFQNCQKTPGKDVEPIIQGDQGSNGESPPSPIGDDTDWEKISSVFQGKCASCHSGNPSSAAGHFGTILDLEALVNSGYIVPGNSASSILFQRITKQQGQPDFSQLMPPGMPLQQEDIDLIKEFIDVTLKPELVENFVFSDIQERLITPYCIKCHDSTLGNNDIDLSSYPSTMMAVYPGNPDGSLIYDSIIQYRMPKDGATVPDEVVILLKDWIKAGAVEK